MDKSLSSETTPPIGFFRKCGNATKGGSVGRLLNLGKLGTTVGLAQVLVQGIGFLSGILVIRLLPTSEYALYTLANTLLGTMTILADGGISTGVMAQGGKVWQDRDRLGAVLATGMTLRKQFALYGLLVSVPILLVLLHQNGASWLLAGLITLSLIPAFISQLSGRLLEIAPKLSQDVAPIQRIQVEANLGRLLLTALTIFVFPFAWVAILCSGLSQFFANWRIRPLSNKYADRTQPEDREVREAVLKIVRRKIPGAIYYCLSGQIAIWLIALFGSTTAVAQLGALSRLAMVLGILTMVLNYLVVPRFSRLPQQRGLLAGRFFLVLAALWVFSVAVIVLVFHFPTEVLWLLGDAYAGLTHELLLMSASSLIGLLSGACYLLNSARGLIPPPALFIPFTLALQMLAILNFDLSQLSGVIWINIAVGLGQLLLHIGYFVYTLFEVPNQPDRNP